MKQKLGAAVLAAGVLAGGAAVATASAGVTAADGVITSCADAKSGALRTVTAGEPCRKGEAPLTWNQVGPQGEPGPAGEPGPQGPAGEPGPIGPAGPAAFAHGYHARGGLWGVSWSSPDSLVATTTLQAGSYLVFASAQANLRDLEDSPLRMPLVTCGLSAAGFSIDQAQESPAGYSDSATAGAASLSLSGIVTVYDSTPMRLHCSQFGAVEADFVGNLNAIAVDVIE